jgi:hypothetical protein
MLILKLISIYFMFEHSILNFCFKINICTKDLNKSRVHNQCSLYIIKLLKKMYKAVQYGLRVFCIVGFNILKIVLISDKLKISEHQWYQIYKLVIIEP